jgi:hypothetical protein
MGNPIVVTAGGVLNVSGDAVFNAAGVAELELGPVPPSQVWQITRMTVSATSTLQPTCSVYDGAAVPANLMDATRTGNQDVSDFGTPYQLQTAESLLFRWEGGTPGAVATGRLVGRTAVA